MPAAPTVNEQVIEAVVSGPHGANRLYTCTGHALIPMGASPNETKRKTWTFLVGPGFRRATATAAVAGFGVQVEDPTAYGWHNLTFGLLRPTGTTRVAGRRCESKLRYLRVRGFACRSAGSLSQPRCWPSSQAPSGAGYYFQGLGDRVWRALSCREGGRPGHSGRGARTALSASYDCLAPEAGAGWIPLPPHY
jgi:hypothetical protein